MIYLSRLFSALLMYLAFGALAAQESELAPVQYQWGTQIPMRDGVNLNATVYLPGNSAGRHPAIVTITPYISDRYHPDAQYFAQRGYVFVIVDTRGRGNSEGRFAPMSQSDGIDGHDVVEWIAKQPWSNGKVAMRGGSYGGFNQWATARHQPVHLSTIVPIASAFPGIDFPMNYNVPYPYQIQWATLTSGRTPNGRIFGDSQFWQAKFREYHVSGMAFADLGKLVGNPDTVFEQWVQHPTFDEFFAVAAPTDAQFADIDLPILTITGYYDGDQPGAMAYYQRHMAHTSPAVRQNHYLLLGPWNHSGTRIPKQAFGGMEFGDKMMFDAFGLDKAWYDWTMGNGPRPAFIKDRVTYFVAGKNTWKSAPSLDAMADEELVLYLASEGYAGNVTQAGSLAARAGIDLHNKAAGPADWDSYRYDPLDTRKAEAPQSEDYIVDQSEVFATQGDGLIYHSRPFEQAFELSGYVEFHGYFAMDVPDTDINVTLYEILADGSSIALTGQTMRARYRTSLEQATLVEPGNVEEYHFNHFYIISRHIAKGSRLRLFIRPANGLSQQRNYNSGKAVNFETRADARTANVKLYHNSRYPSRLRLPVVATP